MAASNIVQIIIQATDAASGVFKTIGASSGEMGDGINKAVDKATKDMAKAQTALVGLKDNMVGTIGSFKGLVADFGMIGIGASIAKTAESWADSVYNLRRAVGGTAQDASQLLAIGKYAGIGTDEAATYFAKFGKAISTAKDEMQKAAAQGKQSNDVFSRLGISFEQINGKNVGDVFALIADKLRNMADGADKGRIAMELFGRSGFQVTEMLNLSKDQIDEITEKARESGLILNDETTEGWHNLGLEVKAVGGAMQGFAIQIGNELLPTLKGQLDAINDLIGAHRNLSPEMQKVIGYGIQAIGMFGEYRLACMAISALAPALGAALTGPWGMAAAAIGIATAKVLDYIETLHKVPSYNEKAEVREIGDDGLGHMLHQKKQQINTFLGMPVYDWDVLFANGLNAIISTIQVLLRLSTV